MCGIGLATWLTFSLMQPKYREEIFKNDKLSMRIRPVMDSGGWTINLVFNNFTKHDILIYTSPYNLQVFGLIDGKEEYLSIAPSIFDPPQGYSSPYKVLTKESETTCSYEVIKRFSKATKIRVNLSAFLGSTTDKSDKNPGGRPLNTEISASIEAPSQSGF